MNDTIVVKSDVLPSMDSVAVDDKILQLFIAIAETGVSLGFTITVRGAILTGQLVGMSAYMERLSNEFRKAARARRVGKDLLETLTTSFEDAAESIAEDAKRDFEELYSDEEISEEFKGRVYNFIHMCDVTIFAGNTELKLSTWRGFSSSVDGFSLGSVS